MAIARMVVPWSNGNPAFPGVEQVEYVVVSYAPPPPGTANYVLVEMRASQADIDALAARADCLFICAVTEDGFVATALSPTDRNNIVSKIQSMGFTGAIYGLLVAAIQASQNRGALAVNLSTAAFFRNVSRDYMTEADVRGGMLNRSV